MSTLEIEIKFYLENPEAARKAILNLGATSSGRLFETNHILDDPEQTLFKKNSLLRLRQDTRALLTYKSPAPVPDSRFKINREFEAQVEDFTTMQQILEKIGFRTVRIYEKWRETFELRDTHLCLDTLPYGNFLEIEGSKKEAINLSKKLGFIWSRRSVLNYQELFELVKADLDLTFSDITFSNFEGISVDMLKLSSRFESGN